MPVIIDRTLVQSEALKEGLNNYQIIITSKVNGQKRIDDLNLFHQNLVTANSSQMAAETQMEVRTAQKNSTLKAVKDAVAEVEEAANSAFEDDPATLKLFKVDVAKPRTDQGWVAHMDYLTTPVYMNSDALIANGMAAEDVANFPVLYANLVAAIAAQKNATKVRNAATKTRDAACRALGRKITTTREFAKAALKGNAAALEEIKPVKNARGKSKIAPPVPEPTTAQK